MIGGRPRSIRGRVTLTVVLALALILLPLATGVAFALRTMATNHERNEAEAAALQVADAVRERIYLEDIPPRGPVDLLQVVDERGAVVATSEPLKGRPAFSRATPASGGDDRVQGVFCAGEQDHQSCLMFVGLRVPDSKYGPAMVYAGVQEPAFLDGPQLEAGLAMISGSLLLFAGWATWIVAGRVLRPVEEMTTEMAEITASDLSRRMPVPDGDDELARLALTLNATLGRLEVSADNQRRFVSDASHELRTPITGLRTRIELALDDPEGTDARRTLREALSDSERLHHIVSDLLQLARLDAGAKAPRENIDLAELATAEAERRPARLPIELDLDPGAEVDGSRLQLSRLLTNLLANADRYSNTCVLVKVYPQESFAVVEVHDDGPGIPEQERERVFERFTRLDTARSRDGGGSGLGLPIAREIAVAHGGTLSIHWSQRLGGALLVLRLPRTGA